MSQQDNIQAQQQFGEAVNSGNFAMFHSLVAPNSIDHDPAPGQAAGPEGYVQFFTELLAAFPDLHLTVDKMVADEDSVAFAYTMSGTHKGAFQGVAPTDRKVSARGMQISRFAGGKMVERWGSSDELGILKQLGVQP